MQETSLMKCLHISAVGVLKLENGDFEAETAAVEVTVPPIVGVNKLEIVEGNTLVGIETALSLTQPEVI